MSKIIKAFQLTQVKSFDFQEIEKEPALPEEPEPRAEPEEEPQSESDPLEDLEALIQKRLEEANRTAQQMEKEGYEKGYAEGREDGYKEGRETMAHTKERLDGLFLQLQHMPEKVFQDYRGWFVETVLAVARQIVRSELSCRPELLTELIDSLLAEAEKDHNMVLYLNPDDLDAIEQNLEQLEAIKKAGDALAIKADAELSQGGCRLESTMQLLDATIETRFSVIRDLLSGHGVKGENGTSH